MESGGRGPGKGRGACEELRASGLLKREKAVWAQASKRLVGQESCSGVLVSEPVQILSSVAGRLCLSSPLAEVGRRGKRAS